MGIILVLFEGVYNFSPRLAVLVIIYFGYIERTSLILQDGIATGVLSRHDARAQTKLEDNFSKERGFQMEEHSAYVNREK